MAAAYTVFLAAEDTDELHNASRSLDLDAIFASMSERARKLLREAMELPVSERAALAADLIASLDGEPDKGRRGSWAAEVSRRARESGDDDVPWETVSAEMLSGTSS